MTEFVHTLSSVLLLAYASNSDFSQKNCGSTQPSCANDVCSWKALKKASTGCPSTCTCAWCTSTCKPSSVYLPSDSLLLTHEEESNVTTSEACNVRGCQYESCMILGEILCSGINSDSCPGARMSGILAPLYREDEIILVTLTNISSCHSKIGQIFVKFNTSNTGFPRKCRADPDVSECIHRQLCAPIIIQDRRAIYNFFWQISSPTHSYKPRWSWETRSLHYNMSTYCCPSDAKSFAPNSIPVRVNINIASQPDALDNIVVNPEGHLIEPLFNCSPSSTLEINITYPSSAAQSLSYINPSASNFTCFSKSYTRNGITYVPYLSPIQCHLYPNCSEMDGESTTCADKRIEHNVRIQASSSNCYDKLKGSDWGYLLKGVQMRVTGNGNLKYFVWNDTVPETLYLGHDRCLVTFQAVISYPERPNRNTSQFTVGTRISVAYNCRDGECYSPGTVRCNKVTQQCDCESACTGLGSYSGDNCKNLPWCLQTTTFVGIGVGCFITVSLSITICVCNRRRIRRRCSCFRRKDGDVDSQGERDRQ